jgi:hypothetical protein
MAVILYWREIWSVPLDEDTECVCRQTVEENSESKAEQAREEIEKMHYQALHDSCYS